MRREQKVSSAVVKRLPKYYRYLKGIASKGTIRVSSQELSNITGMTASQIRQDLNHFGEFGQQGYGYNVEELISELENIIGLGKSYKAVVLGLGNIGQAITMYSGFKSSGFEIVALFDNSKKIIGQKLAGKIVKDIKNLKDYLKKNQIEIGIMAVPAESAQELADILVENGIRGIWNFAPIDLKLPEDVILENVHLDESLFTLIYYLNNTIDYSGSK